MKKRVTQMCVYQELKRGNWIPPYLYHEHKPDLALIYDFPEDDSLWSTFKPDEDENATALSQ